MRAQSNARLRLHELWSVSDKLFFIWKVNVISVTLTVDVCGPCALSNSNIHRKMYGNEYEHVVLIFVLLMFVRWAKQAIENSRSIGGHWTLGVIWMFTIFQIGRKTKSLLFMDAFVTKHWTGGIARHGCIGPCVNELDATRENNYYLFVSLIETISMRPQPPELSKRRTIKYLVIIYSCGWRTNLMRHKIFIDSFHMVMASIGTFYRILMWAEPHMPSSSSIHFHVTASWWWWWHSMPFRGMKLCRNRHQAQRRFNSTPALKFLLTPWQKSARYWVMTMSVE